MSGLWDHLPARALADPAKWLQEQRQKREEILRRYGWGKFAKEPEWPSPAYMDRAY